MAVTVYKTFLALIYMGPLNLQIHDFQKTNMVGFQYKNYTHNM